MWKPDAEAIVLDAWKDGPAVFAPDSTRTQVQWLSAFTFRRVSSPEPELLAEAKSDALAIASEHDPRALSAQPPPGWLLSNARSVVSQGFLERVSGKPVPAEDVLEVVRRSNSAMHSESVHAAMPAEIRREILAAGIARELMAPPELPERLPPGQGRVRSAAARAPAIVDTVGNLSTVMPRRYWPVVAPFTFHGLAADAPDVARMIRRRTDACAAIPPSAVPATHPSARSE